MHFPKDGNRRELGMSPAQEASYRVMVLQDAVQLQEMACPLSPGWLRQMGKEEEAQMMEARLHALTVMQAPDAPVSRRVRNPALAKFDIEMIVKEERRSKVRWFLVRWESYHPSKLLSNSLQERPPSPHGTVRRRAAPSIERRAAGGLREENCAPMARHVVSTHAQLHGGTSCAIGCPRSSCRTPSKSVRPRRMAPCEGGRRRRSSGGLPAAFARRTARQWRDTWCQRMNSCTEAHSAPSVALEAPVELPPRASALAAWHRAKAGGAVDRAEGCRRPSRGELRANGATRGVNACTAARRHTLRHRLPSKLLSNSLQELLLL